MKLITELSEEVKLITEAKDGGGENYFIEGIFMQGAEKNKNGRMYPTRILARETARYMKEYVNENRAYGELGHPAGPTINLERVSHMIKSLVQDGDNFIGKAKIIVDNPYGQIVRNLMKEGARLGVSSRGLGTLRPKNGYDEVDEDYHLVTAADIVADPSAPSAFVRGIMESRDYDFVDGALIERVASAKKSVEKAAGTVRGLTEATQIDIFKRFLNSL